MGVELTLAEAMYEVLNLDVADLEQQPIEDV